MALSIEKTSNGPTTLGYMGDIADVIKANLPRELTSMRVKASDYAAGFQLGTPGALQSLGEMVFVNGICFTTSTDRTSKDYMKTIFGRDFIPGGICFIPKEAKPSYRVSFNQEIELLEFYNTLYEEIQRAFIYTGIFCFSKLHGTAIAKPPIDGRNIFENKKEYYPFDEITKSDVYGFVIGAVTQFQDEPKINEKMKRVVYKNPMDLSSKLTDHAHVLTLKRKVNNMSEITSQVADQVLHLFVDGSSFVSGEVEIFTIGDLKDYSRGKGA